jgi:hypothetical protein
MSFLWSMRLLLLLLALRLWFSSLFASFLAHAVSFPLFQSRLSFVLKTSFSLLLRSRRPAFFALPLPLLFIATPTPLPPPPPPPRLFYK